MWSLKCYSGQTYFGPYTTYNLPSGAELLIGNINPTFGCNDRKYGYYAGRFHILIYQKIWIHFKLNESFIQDIDHNCKIFHICYPTYNPMGIAETYQTSFFCPNLTVFDQSTLTCVHEDSDNLIPCSQSPQLYYLNDNFGRTESPNIEISQYYENWLQYWLRFHKKTFPIIWKPNLKMTSLINKTIKLF